MRLYFIRHGETVHNVDRRIQGPLLDDPLNARGVAQAAALERRLAEERKQAGGAPLVAAVYASPMKRAFMTAEAAARGAGAPPPVPLPELVEFSWGKYLGMTETGETLEAMKRYHAAWDAGDVGLAVEGGGESPAGAFERAWRGIGPIIERHATRGEHVALVAHGRIFKVVLSRLVAGDISQMDQFPQGNTALSIVERPQGGGPDLLDGAWRVVLLNDQTHLSGDLASRHGRGPALV